jgi:integrase
LWQAHGAPKLDTYIRAYTGIRPRNVTASREEIDAILNAAPDALRLWVLLCSDLAIRSGTAARLAPNNYNPETRELRFTTKHGARLTLPVTEEIRTLIERCNPHQDIPFARQLWTPGFSRGTRPLTTDMDNGGYYRKCFRDLRLSLGITHRITPHDLRRTTAVEMLNATGDLRAVQALLGHANLNSTVYYLDHDLRPIKRSTLELIKRPAWRKDRIA